MINVFKIKQGDTIEFRNGEVHTVTEARVYDKAHHAAQNIELWVERYGKEDCFTYGDSGGLYYTGYSDKLSDWDIVEHIPNQGEAEEPTQDEMTMRDQFAMSAMSGMLANNIRYASYENMARWSYEVADEMMKARKENG